MVAWSDTKASQTAWFFAKLAAAIRIKFKILLENNKIFELESGEIQNQKYNSAEMLKKAIAEDFPEIPFREISLAVDKTWNSDSSA